MVFACVRDRLQFQRIGGDRQRIDLALDSFMSPEYALANSNASRNGTGARDDLQSLQTVDFRRELTRDFHRELTRVDDGLGVRRSSSFGFSPLRVWRPSPSCS